MDKALESSTKEGKKKIKKVPNPSNEYFSGQKKERKHSYLIQILRDGGFTVFSSCDPMCCNYPSSYMCLILWAAQLWLDQRGFSHCQSSAWWRPLGPMRADDLYFFAQAGWASCKNSNYAPLCHCAAIQASSLWLSCVHTCMLTALSPLGLC